MSLTPLDIHNKEFKRGFRGYDEDQVNEFLDLIIKEFELLIRENRNLQDRAQQANEKLSHYTNIEAALNKSMILAQETADNLKETAEKEATLIVKEAERDANAIINKAYEKIREMQLESEELKNQVALSRSRFKILLETQLEMLQSEDWNRATGQEKVEDQAKGLKLFRSNHLSMASE